MCRWTPSLRRSFKGRIQAVKARERPENSTSRPGLASEGKGSVDPLSAELDQPAEAVADGGAGAIPATPPSPIPARRMAKSASNNKASR